MSTHYAVYELQGRSRQAAIRLYNAVLDQVRITPVLRTGNLKDISDSWQTMYAALIERLKKQSPDILDQTGYNNPSTMVRNGKDAFPRAYMQFPEILFSPEHDERDMRVVMYAPRDYNGNHFIPADSILLDEDNERLMGEFLNDTPPIVTLMPRGIATPPDFRPGTSLSLPATYSPDKTQSHRCFIARGRSLQLVSDYEQRKSAYEQQTNDMFDRIRKAAEEQFPALLQSLPAGEELYVNLSASEGGNLKKPQFQFSIRRKGNGDFMAGGKPVAPVESPHFTAKPGRYGDHIVAPRTDTPEGRVFAAALNDVKARPSMADYPELRANFKFTAEGFQSALGVNGIVPQLHNLNGRSLLVYNADADDQSAFCPPGAQEISPREYHWLRNDEDDMRRGITPPPAPAQLSHLFEARGRNRRRPGGGPSPAP